MNYVLCAISGLVAVLALIHIYSSRSDYTELSFGRKKGKKEKKSRRLRRKH